MRVKEQAGGSARNHPSVGSPPKRANPGETALPIGPSPRLTFARAFPCARTVAPLVSRVSGLQIQLVGADAGVGLDSRQSPSRVCSESAGAVYGLPPDAESCKGLKMRYRYHATLKRIVHGTVQRCQDPRLPRGSFYVDWGIF